MEHGVARVFFRGVGQGRGLLFGGEGGVGEEGGEGESPRGGAEVTLAL